MSLAAAWRAAAQSTAAVSAIDRQADASDHRGFVAEQGRDEAGEVVAGGHPRSDISIADTGVMLSRAAMNEQLSADMSG